MRKTIFAAAAAVMCALMPAQAGAQQPLQGGTSYFVLNGATGQLEATVNVPEQKQANNITIPPGTVVIDVANDYRPNSQDRFKVRNPPSLYGGTASPEVSRYGQFRSDAYVLADVKIHRAYPLQPGEPWDQSYVRPGRDTVEVIRLYDNYGHVVNLKTPIFQKLIPLNNGDTASTAPRQPTQQLPPSSQQPAQRCTSMACCNELEREYNAAISPPLPFALNPQIQSWTLQQAAENKRAVAQCRHDAALGPAAGYPSRAPTPNPPPYPPAYPSYPQPYRNYGGCGVTVRC